jgi:hypothetical protein
MKVSTKDLAKEVEELKKTATPHQVEEFINGLWVVLFSDDAFSKEGRKKLIEIFKKLKYLAKKEKKSELEKRLKKQRKLEKQEKAAKKAA